MNILQGSECKGCSYDDADWTNVCRIDGVGLTEICPCRKCVVKTMCSEVCDAYKMLRSKAEQLKYK